MPINPDVYKSLLSELSKINRTVLPDPFYGQLNVPNGRARAMIHEAMVQSEIEMRLAEEQRYHELHSASSLSTDGGGPKAVNQGSTDSLTTNLLAFFTLNNTLVDNFGGNNLGPLDSQDNPPTYSGSRLRWLDSSPRYNYNAASTVYDQTQDFTMFGWIQPGQFGQQISNNAMMFGASEPGGASTSGGYGAGITFYATSNTQTGLTIIAYNDNNTNGSYIQISNGNAGGMTYNQYIQLVNSFNPYVITYKSSTKQLSLSAFNTQGGFGGGIASGRTTLSDVQPDMADNGVVFAIGDMSQNFNNQQIASVGLWQRVLTGPEITRLVNNGTPINYDPSTKTFK